MLAAESDAHEQSDGSEAAGPLRAGGIPRRLNPRLIERVSSSPGPTFDGLIIKIARI